MLHEILNTISIVTDFETVTMVSTPIVWLCCLLASVLAVPVQKYTDKYDSIDMHEIVENPKLLHGYSDCLLDKGPCTPEGKDAKANLRDGLETGCGKCTEIQKDKVTIFIEHVIKNERGIWKELTDKYDPEGIWRKKYEDAAKEKGIIIPKD
ncbi:unnamed protein product, partial [Brenthis ino]